MSIFSTRKENLILLIGKDRTKDRVLLWGTSASTISQIISKNSSRNLGEKLARKIETCEGLPEGWLDIAHTPEALAQQQEIKQTVHAQAAVRVIVRHIQIQLDAYEAVVNPLKAHVAAILASSDVETNAAQAIAAIGKTNSTLDIGELSKDLLALVNQNK